MAASTPTWSSIYVIFSPSTIFTFNIATRCFIITGVRFSCLVLPCLYQKVLHHWIQGPCGSPIISCIVKGTGWIPWITTLFKTNTATRTHTWIRFSRQSFPMGNKNVCVIRVPRITPILLGIIIIFWTKARRGNRDSITIPTFTKTYTATLSMTSFV